MTSQRIDQILDMTHPPTRHLDLVKVTIFYRFAHWSSFDYFKLDVLRREARVNAQARVK